MQVISTISNSYKKYMYSLLAVVIIAILTFGYISYILPKNQQKEDAKNIATLNGISNQLNAYIDDQIKYIDEDKSNDPKIKDYKGSTKYYIDSIFYNKSKQIELQQGIIKFPRIIHLSKRIKEPSEKPSKEDTIKDFVYIDLAKFINKISSSTPFTSFYLCPVESEKCQTRESFLSKDIPVIDQDSLIHYSRKRSPFSFKNSFKRYYTNHIYIPQTKQTIFLAAGVDNSTFQNNVQQINTNLLIFSLMLTIIMILGINFIKPIVSSYKEILSQTDLIGVVFSSGILIAVLVVFTTLFYWNNSIKSKNEDDLKLLVNKINGSLSEQITAYENWKLIDSAFKKNAYNSNKPFAKLILKKDSISTSLDGEPLTNKEIELTKEQKYEITASSFFDKNNVDSKLIKYLDCYFQMDNTGLMKTNIIKNIPEIPRKYADRNYFKTLQEKNRENEKTQPVLSAVFSREDNEYQLIYAEKDALNDKNQKSKNTGINGIAFREYLSDELELPPGTGYMLVDRKGEVLLQNDPEKNLYQNLLNGSQNNPDLISLLSGVAPSSFEMEYQGIFYQVYAKKISLNIGSPVYILGIRDLAHLNRLSIFSFGNGFLFSVLFGFLMLCLTYTYSVFFYSGRIRILSMHHFSHLFPDNSRTEEYKILATVSGISILLALLVFLLTSISFSFIFCIMLGSNVVLINFIMLSVRVSNPFKEIIRLIIILCLCSFGLLLARFFGLNELAAFIILFAIHFSVLRYYQKWRTRENISLETIAEKNKGVNKKAFTQFLTARLLYQFAVFPFIIVSMYYVNEINDFANYYCSWLNAKNTKMINQNAFIIKDNRITDAYSCNCIQNKDEPYKTDKESIKKDSIQQDNIQKNRSENYLQKINLGFLDRPASYEIKNFTINKLHTYEYIKSSAIFSKGNNLLYQILNPISLLLVFFLLAILAFQLLNYYSNRFFFYDLMQAAYEKYYPCTKTKFTTEQIVIPMIENEEIKKLLEVDASKKGIIYSTHPNLLRCTERETTIDNIFDKDSKFEITLAQRINFMLNYNNKEFANDYNEIWKSLPDEQTRYVLYDFAQDQFANYKNKDIIRNLMEKGIIDSHRITGRLKLMSPGFRLFILYKRKNDVNFVQKFAAESKNGTFSRLKFPILLIAVCALTLLLYLNKDSYDKVTVVGGSILSVWAFINKFIEANKTL